MYLPFNWLKQTKKLTQQYMVICPHSHIKDFNRFVGLFHGNLPSYRQVEKQVLLFAAQHLTGRVKITVIFSYGLLALAFCQLKIRHRDEIVR